MKITRTNINDKWSEIEKYLSDQIKKSSASYLEMARDWDTLSKEFTKEELDETKALLDNFIAKVNEQVEAGLKKYTPKPYIPKVAEAPAWLKTLRSFVNMVGKEKPVSSIRKLVLDIQDRFDAKRGKHTNHIELIREIQDKLIPYANKKADKKVTLPEWKDLTDRCKVAIKSVSVSTKLSKDDVTSIELSGHRK